MDSPNQTDESLKERCEYKTKCENAATDYCQGCGQIYCVDHYSKHQRRFQKRFKYIKYTHAILIEKLKSLILQLSADGIFDLLKRLYEFKMISDEMEKTANTAQQQLQDIVNEAKQDLKKQLTNESKSPSNSYFENNMEHLEEDIEQLKIKLEEINNYIEKTLSQEQSNIDDMTNLTDSPPETIESPKQENHFSSADDTSSNGSSALSRVLLRQMSPSMLDVDENDYSNADKETQEEREEEMIGVIDSKTVPRTRRRIRLSNNIVSVMRGPFKVVLDGTIHMVEACAHETHASHAVKQAVEQGLARQKETTNSSLKPTFVEITSDWTFEGPNADQGFSSESIWMRDPQDRRVLVKIHDHPLGAANEWLAYALGDAIYLPINEVQIGLYKNNLVTLHTDVTHENEKTVTFMDLPRRIRKILLTDPILECMDLFDHIIQNVDRNPRNILITMPNTTTVDDDTAKLKVYLIDHTASFGLGKLNGISVMASKLRSQHLTVVKFNPINQAKKFEQYLSKLPTADRVLIRKTLNGFAAITDDQFDSWMMEVRDLLSDAQYNRILSVLGRQRDIAKRYSIRWGISRRSFSIKSNEIN